MSLIRQVGHNERKALADNLKILEKNAALERKVLSDTMQEQLKDIANSIAKQNEAIVKQNEAIQLLLKAQKMPSAA
jgi:hypothetical protein